ncbi:MAG: preprotein translocase subunit SecE [Xanthomonadaceae bacterium]|nr:preprotein translocase subunit SecE [Rhodospirillaceae bacterium]NIA17949.1 preprotein translocase subunit SecE [Xanthomonadaceae bacterium]
MKVANNKLTQYIYDSYAEIKKVTWPTRQETIRLTIAVILISLFIAAFLGALDSMFSFGVEKIITTFHK